MNGTYHRDRLPEPLAYYQDTAGLVLTGRGKWRTTRCEFHGGSDSMGIHVEAGAFLCRAGCGAKGHDVLAYHRRSRDLGFVEAARDLGAWDDESKDAPDDASLPAKAVKARPVEPPRRVGLSNWAHNLWHSTQELAGVALQYLESRHCWIPPAYGDLRWHPALKHPSGYVGPALVALITDVRTRSPLSLHRTWVTPTGKAEVDPRRMLLKDHPIAGGVIRLTPDDEVGALLGIAEGVETALSLAWAPLPVWALIDAGHLVQFPVLDGITTLVISQDQDTAGRSAAAICAQRWADAGREVFITQQDANDLNDMLMEAT